MEVDPPLLFKHQTQTLLILRSSPSHVLQIQLLLSLVDGLLLEPLLCGFLRLRGLLFLSQLLPSWSPFKSRCSDLLQLLGLSFKLESCLLLLVPLDLASCFFVSFLLLPLEFETASFS